MNWQDVALLTAGLIGSGVAVIHGVLTQRLMVRPFDAAFRDNARMAPAVKRLVPLMLHFSTVTWFAGGLALIAAVFWFDASARLATALCVGALYFFGAAGNLLGTRSFHPGWMLYGVALVLIAFGVGAFG